MNKIIVMREGHLLSARVINNGIVTETVKAANAQILLDWVRGEWPIGTTVNWIVRPQ